VEEHAYYVNKLRLKTWICRRKQRTPNTNDRRMPLNEKPSHENFLRTSLMGSLAKDCFQPLVYRISTKTLEKSPAVFI